MKVIFVIGQSDLYTICILEKDTYLYLPIYTVKLR